MIKRDESVTIQMSETELIKSTIKPEHGKPLSIVEQIKKMAEAKGYKIVENEKRKYMI